VIATKPSTASTARSPRGSSVSSARRFHRECLLELKAAGFETLVGGGYALEPYLGAGRQVKDLDLFVRPRDVERLLRHLDARECRCERTFPHWLAKVQRGPHYIDVIFNGGNGACPVDDEWLLHGVPARVLDVDVRLCPPEEMIWSKAFVMERERYDGADVAHLLRACADQLDWARLTRRFDSHWRVLFSHLILFGFIYPSERHRIPTDVMRRCLRLARQEMGEGPSPRICRGTLLSRAQYLIDTNEWGYQDARLTPHGVMTRHDATIWTAAIDEEESRPLATPADEQPA
jgi:hypothetical protein